LLQMSVQRIFSKVMEGTRSSIDPVSTPDRPPKGLELIATPEDLKHLSSPASAPNRTPKKNKHFPAPTVTLLTGFFPVDPQIPDFPVDPQIPDFFVDSSQETNFDPNLTKSAICAFVPSHKHQLFPVSNHLNRVPIFDDKKLINGNYIQKINADRQISDFSGDSFQEVLNQFENYFSTDNSTGTTKYIRPKDTIGIGALIAPAVRNEFNFDATYTGVTKFAIVLLQSTAYELNFPSPSLDRKRLRELLLPGIVTKIDDIRSFRDAQNVVNEIGCAYLHNATFGKMAKFSRCSKQKPKMSSKKMARELHIEARLHGKMPGDNTIIDFKLAPISNLANSKSKEEGLLELAIIEYCMQIFEPYKKFSAFAPVRNNLAVAKDIQRSCDSILINRMKGGFLDRSFLMIANRKVLAVLNDIILMVKTVDDTTSCLRLRQSKKSGSKDDEEERVESMFFEDLTEPELKAYLLSLVSSLRQENASATHSSIPYIKYFRRFRRRKRRNFREITARYLKEMSDMCRDEESIVRATFHKQEIRFNSMRDQERYNDIVVEKIEQHSGTT